MRAGSINPRWPCKRGEADRSPVTMGGSEGPCSMPGSSGSWKRQEGPPRSLRRDCGRAPLGPLTSGSKPVRIIPLARVPARASWQRDHRNPTLGSGSRVGDGEAEFSSHSHRPRGLPSRPRRGGIRETGSEPWEHGWCPLPPSCSVRTTGGRSLGLPPPRAPLCQGRAWGHLQPLGLTNA